MTNIGFSSSFKRAYKKFLKTNSDLETKFWIKLELFQQNPFSPELKTHKLSRDLKDLWSFRIDYDNRVIFFFPDNNKDKAILVDIGKHDVVY